MDREVYKAKYKLQNLGFQVLRYSVVQQTVLATFLWLEFSIIKCQERKQKVEMKAWVCQFRKRKEGGREEEEKKGTYNACESGRSSLSL